MQLQTWLKSARHNLHRAEIESAHLDALLLAEYCIGKSREWILAYPEHELSSEKVQILNTYISRRKAHEPLAYIVGSKEFYGHAFSVNQNVLIPRPESEAIIELLHKLLANTEINTVIDVGTGSGCLAITTKLLHPDIHVTALDNSAAALSAAKKNARTLGAQIQFRQLDIYEGLPDMPKTRPYVILANLPYVPDELITSREITREPAEALFSGSDGLNHYRTLWQQILRLKNKPAYVITESLTQQHAALTQLAGHAGYQLHDTDVLAQCFALN